MTIDFDIKQKFIICAKEFNEARYLWHHYMDEYIARYDMPSLPTDMSVTISKKYVKEYIQRNADTIFFVKHNHWEHENEYRMIKRGEREMSLSVSNAITNIYVYNVDDISADIVNRLIPESLNLYALWVETKGDTKVIDKIDYRWYKTIMSGNVKLKFPNLSLNK